MKLSAFALCALLLAACSTAGNDQAPEVDWSGVRPAERAAIEDGARNRDCELLDAYYKTEANAEVLYYLDWAMKHADC